MKPERSGVVGSLLADRPVTIASVAAAGLVALAYLGVEGAGAAAAQAGRLSALLLSFIALPVLPLGLAAFTPATRAGYALSVAAAVAVAAALWIGWPLIAPGLPHPDSRFYALGLALFAVFLLLRPAVGAALRFGFVGAASAVLGVAGAAGLMARTGAEIPEIAAFGALGLALAAPVAIGVAADFSAYYARGVDPRSAAIASSEHAVGPVAMATALAFVSVVLHALLGGGGGVRLGWTAALVAALATAIATAFATGAVSLTTGGEAIAVVENARRQRLRRLWRPLRRSISTSTAYAVVAVVFILLLILAFDLKAAPAPALLVYAPAAGIVAGLCLISMRGGLFVAVLTTVAVVATSWIFERDGASGLSPQASAVGYGVLAAGFAMLAASWRDARSPRLNARETMEAALTDGVGRFAASLACGAGALYAAAFSGAWPEGVDAAARALVGGLFGLVLAPALMTALAAIGGRDRF